MHLDVKDACLFLPLFRNNTGPEKHDTTGLRPGASEASDGEAAVAHQQEHSASERLDETVGDGPTGVPPVLSAAAALETAEAQQEGRGFKTIDRDAATPISDGGGRFSGGTDGVAICGKCDHVAIGGGVVHGSRGPPDEKRSLSRGDIRCGTIRVGQLQDRERVYCIENLPQSQGEG